MPNSAAEDSGTLTYTVAMTNPVDAAVSVDYTVAGSGANPIDGSDLTSPYNVATTLTFPQGDNSSLTFVVDPATDNLVENAEGFTASLSNVSSTIAGTGITTGSANGTITNDDDYEITISAPVPNSAAEDSGTLTYTVAMTNPVDAVVSVDYTVTGSGAHPIDGADLTSPYNVATTLTFPQGDNSSLTFVVDPATDNLVENAEGFTASLSNVSSTIAGTGITTGSANGTITNDDDYEITISAPVPNSAAEDTGTLTYTVAMTNPVDAAVSVDYTVTGSGAHPIDGADLTSPYNVATTLTFPQGDNSSLTFVVDPATDNLVEHDEGFNASLSNLGSTIAGTGITTGSANGTITNDDDYTVSISAPAVNSVNEDGGALTYTLSIDAPVDEQVDVNYSIAGLNVNISDISPLSGTVSFPSGSSAAQQLVIDPITDSVVERDELFTVSITGVTTSPAIAGTGNIGANTADGIILNDDTYPVHLSVETVAQNEGNSPLQFTVVIDQTPLAGGDPNPVLGGVYVDDVITVNLSTTDGTAGGSDYALATPSVTFTPATPAPAPQTVDITLVDDSEDEATEDFTLVLAVANPALAHITGNNGTGQIENDDYTITYTNNNEGSVTPAGVAGVDYLAGPGAGQIMVDRDASPAFTITATHGTLDILVDGAGVGAPWFWRSPGFTDTYTFPAKADTNDMTFEAMFLNRIDMDVIGSDGELTHTGPPVTTADPPTHVLTIPKSIENFIVTPTSPGYCPAEVTVDGISLGPIFTGTFEVDMMADPDHPVPVTAEFKLPNVQVLIEPSEVRTEATWSIYYGKYNAGVGMIEALGLIAGGQQHGDVITLPCDAEAYVVTFSSVTGYVMPDPIRSYVTSARYDTMVETGTYKRNIRVLTLDTIGNGTGSTDHLPVGEVLEVDRRWEFTGGTVITLTVVSDAGSVFTQWGGELPALDANGNALDKTSTSIDIILDQDRAITASFSLYCDDSDGDGFPNDPDPSDPNDCISIYGPDPWAYDCNDGDSSIYPGAPEICNETPPVDQNCGWVYNPETNTYSAAPPGEEVCDVGDEDQDGDGYTPRMGDCLDTGSISGILARDINPSAYDDCSTTNIDEDCFGGDGWDTVDGEWSSTANWDHVGGNANCGDERTCEASISNDPLNTAVKPANPMIMVLFDDSGSMDWQIMNPDDAHGGVDYFSSQYYGYLYSESDHNYSSSHTYGGRLEDTETGKRRWKNMWADWNSMYFNPVVEYKPWARWHVARSGGTGINDNAPASSKIKSLDNLWDSANTLAADEFWKEDSRNLVHASIDNPRIKPNENDVHAHLMTSG